MPDRVTAMGADALLGKFHIPPDSDLDFWPIARTYSCEVLSSKSSSLYHNPRSTRLILSNTSAFVSFLPLLAFLIAISSHYVSGRARNVEPGEHKSRRGTFFGIAECVFPRHNRDQNHARERARECRVGSKEAHKIEDGLRDMQTT